MDGRLRKTGYPRKMSSDKFSAYDKRTSHKSFHVLPNTAAGSSLESNQFASVSSGLDVNRPAIHENNFTAFDPSKVQSNISVNTVLLYKHEETIGKFSKKRRDSRLRPGPYGSTPLQETKSKSNVLRKIGSHRKRKRNLNSQTAPLPGHSVEV